MLAQLRQWGVATVFLEVRESNSAARRLYGALGFAQVGRRRNYYRRPTEDAVVLRATI
jgi:ribosomal-protein-alanine N-acetyltransferase